MRDKNPRALYDCNFDAPQKTPRIRYDWSVTSSVVQQQCRGVESATLIKDFAPNDG